MQTGFGHGSMRAARPRRWHLGSRLRQLRLASGLVLFAYVLSHLADHALCNASWRAADAMLLVRPNSPRCG
jgi:adenylate cyclase